MTKLRAVLVFGIVVAIFGCEPPVDAVVIADDENREYFKSLLKNENISYQVVVESGEEVLRFHRSSSERVRELIDKYGGRELLLGHAVCYKDEQALVRETDKLSAANAPYKLVRNYEYTCIVWDEAHSEKVKSVLY